MNIFEKLGVVQNELKAPKGQFNKFGNYNYRSCEDIQEAVKPILKKVSAALLIGDELVLIGDRYYIKATVKFVDCENGSEISNTAYAREELDKKGMDASQITGSASSYARKYALNGLFCIDDVKDADTNEHSNNKQDNRNKGDSKPSNNTGARDQLLAEFEQEIRRTGKSLTFFLKQAGVSEVKYIKNDKLQEFITNLKVYASKDVS